ncbi:PREDICTED: glucose-6-phosphatase 2-like isoform X1 [Priapulus caudatus]|uniref:glucose-6-phosphatase n=1 Tax=Priapulus caudatus TaxID=37621 RepID=A0ABM1DYR6_PRICU|nr:PREDICTED: glucose-6-phosphatase 2-like isoform X1 [Priapulus caudatus]
MDAVRTESFTPMEMLDWKGLEFIGGLQNLMAGREEQLFAWSRYGDPAKLFVVYFPLLFCLSNKWGIRLMWIGVLGEWLNLCLKWLLFGDRPYWYAVEMAQAHPNVSVPFTQQYPMTCETGPGNPSGHAMITGAVWCVLATALLKKLEKHIWSDQKRCPTLVYTAVWSTFSICYLLVCLSRLSLAAHFPHQVIAGVICGMLLLAAMSTVALSAVRVRTYIITSALLLAGAYGLYVSLRLVGINPDWSVVKALTFCDNRAWVHLNTAPLHSLARLCGALLGLGLGLYAREHTNAYHESQQHKRNHQHALDIRMVSAVLAVFLYKCAESIPLSQDPIELFYVAAFVKHTIVPVLVVAVVPVVANHLLTCFYSIPKSKFAS